MVTPRQIEWAAAFLEGEGSFVMDPGIRVSAQQVEREPLDKLAGILGGRVRKIGTRNCHNWQITGKRAAAAMMTVYGMMCSRRRGQIADCLSAWMKKPVANQDKTRCSRDHEYAGDNLLRVHGRRRCRICHNAGVN